MSVELLQLTVNTRMRDSTSHINDSEKEIRRKKENKLTFREPASTVYLWGLSRGQV